MRKHIAEYVDGRVRFAAFTGKAAKVLRSKGCTDASTIHRLIYDVETNPETGVVTKTLTDARVRKLKLIIVDECSMVDEEIGNDLLSFGIPVLVLGDPGQLPPVRGQGYFTSGRPNYMLRDIHRQAAESPIIDIATRIREGDFRGEEMVTEGLTICRRENLDPSVVPAAGAVIVGRNATRDRFNQRMREIRGYTDDTPQPGEPVICLRNDRELQIFNGEVFEVDKRRRSRRTAYGRVLNYVLSDPEDAGRDPFKVSVYEHCFQGVGRLEQVPFKARAGTHQFDYGYTITCHKAQGSQWDDVVVFDESRAFRDDASKWLYTAVTRAANNLTLVV